MSTPPFSPCAGWRVFAELACLLDVPAASAPELMPRALRLLGEGTGSIQTVLAMALPDEPQVRICSSYPGVAEARRADLSAAIARALRSGQVLQEAVRRPEAGSQATQASQAPQATLASLASQAPLATVRVVVPLRHEGQVFGALCADIAADIAADPAADMEPVTAALTVAAALFVPGLRAHAAALRTPGLPGPASLSRILGDVGLVGTSEAMQPVYARLAQVAPTATTVLLRGESGTGKELVARALHAASPRAQGPFVSLNCGALPESLIESELFGHEKGAFTGASALRKGRFELAHGGTLFLDEVGELPLLTQVKLLRVLQERRFERLGGMESRKVDIRIITATNRPLEAMVDEGGFRRDLYYRLNVFSIHLPALRERKSDILLLANHFLDLFATRLQRPTPSVALSAADMLHRYAWPGNIRELENMMERALVLMDGGALLLPQHLPPELHSAACPFCSTGLEDAARPHLLSSASLTERLEELERVSIIDALTGQRGHIGQAAAVLGLTERVLHLRMRKYGLTFQEFRKRS